MSKYNPLNFKCLPNRMGMEQKLPFRFKINSTILKAVTVPTSATALKSRLLNLPDEVILHLYNLSDAPTQVALALTCKYMGQVAAWGYINAYFVEDTADTADEASGNEDDTYDTYNHDSARYNRDVFRNYRTNPIVHDATGLRQGSTFRTNCHLREGLYVDLPKLMLTLQPDVPKDLKLCGHCMTFRPKDVAYWEEKRAGSTIDGGAPVWNARTAWAKKEVLIHHVGVRKKVTRRMDACPFCKTALCSASSRNCSGCRMQAELRKLVKGKY